MKSPEQFKKEMTEEEKPDSALIWKNRQQEGRPSAETAAEYIRSKGYDVTEADIQPLADGDLEDVAGGKLGGSGDYCNHNFILTGAEKKDSYYIFWEKTYREKKCTKCGQTRWEQVD